MKTASRLLSLALLAVLALPPARARAADEGWTLITADFRRHPVNLAGLDDQGVHVTRVATPAAAAATAPTAGEAYTVPFDDFLELERYAGGTAPAGDSTLYLASGDRLGGQIVSLKDELLNWRSPALGELSVSIRQLRAIVRNTPAGPPAGLDAEHREDQVVLANGDSVKGIITDIAAGKVNVQAGGDSVPAPLASAAAIYFAAPAQVPPPSQRAFRIRLIDGSILTTTSASVQKSPAGGEGDKLRITLAGAARDLDPSAVRSIEQLNGPVVWLSNRPPQKEEQFCFSADLHYPARMDLTCLGKPIVFAGRAYAHGIGVHAISRLTWTLDGSFPAFRTQYAVDANDTARANLVVRVLVDGKVIHEQAGVRAGNISPVLTFDLGSAKSLTLEVLNGDMIGTQGRLNWIEPALLKKARAAPAQPQPAAATQGSPS